MELWQQPAHKLQKLLSEGEIGARELTVAHLKRLREVEPLVQSFITLTEETALEQAVQIDQRREAGEELPPLAGIPLALKDNFCVQGLATTCGSKMLENYTAIYDATVYRRLRKAGAVLLGKTNMDEFAMGSTSEHSAYHISKNPWDITRVPGGSSGGSAAAVAAGEVSCALGTDTGGSVRQPASFCGLVGLKPTYGRVSRSGVMGYASSLDQVGPLTRDVTDAAILLTLISGYDPLDPTTIKEAVPDYGDFLLSEVTGLKIGVPREYFQGADPEVAAVVWEGIKLLEKMGAKIEETSLLSTDYCSNAYYIVAVAEASSNLACIDGVRYGHRVQADNLEEMYIKSRGLLGPEARRRIILGTYILSGDAYETYYLQAQKVRTLVKEDFAKALEKYDLLITPTSATTAPKIGARCGESPNLYPEDDYNVAVNLAGLPALSLPCGFAQGLPVGMQIIGKPFGEGTLIQAAYSLEQETGYDKMLPDVVAVDSKGVV